MTGSSVTSCPRCRDTGHVTDFDGNVSECPEETCLKQRAVDALGVETLPDGRRIFKGGTMKLSVAIKGFELTSGEIVKVESPGSGYTTPPIVTVEELE